MTPIPPAIRPSSLLSLQARLRRDLAQSPLAASLRDLAQAGELWRSGRPLNAEEIATLQSQGNAAESWDLVRAKGEGSWAGVRGMRFEGRILLAPPAGDLGDSQGRTWPSLLRDSTVRNCVLGRCHLDQVGRMENAVIENGAILSQVERITCAPKRRFALGQKISVGDETGSRSLWFWDGLDLEACEWAASLRPEEQKQFQSDIDTLITELSSDFAYVASGAVLIAVRQIRDSWIGPGAYVEGASLLSGSALLSSMDFPCMLGADARVVDSHVQTGAHVDGAASVLRSLLLEASGVGESGQVADSVLGSNTHAAKGEITSSLVGPFVGFHHQALLIAALWPEGRGNVAYGANVGSNHTGKKADQEIRPGEGMFFGLGCTVKFPANFSNAPYSLIASGVTTLPQRLGYPFSLIQGSSLPTSPETQGLNEIRPGFMWQQNLYALARNSYKYLDRDQCRTARAPLSSHSVVRDGFFGGRLFTPDLIAKVAHAYTELRRLSARQRNEGTPNGSNKSGEAPAGYTSRELPGLGKNVLRREELPTAEKAYAAFLKCALLRWGAEPLAWNDAAFLQEHISSAWQALELPWPQSLNANAAMPQPELRGEWLQAFGTQLTAWLPLLDGLPEAAAASLQRDHKRGALIMDDYADFHGSAAEDAILLRLGKAVHLLKAQLSEGLN